MDSPTSSRPIQIWNGTTPTGYSLIVERDAANHWIATVAAASRSRSESLEAALLEAGGAAIPRHWAADLAATLTSTHPEPGGVTGLPGSVP